MVRDDNDTAVPLLSESRDLAAKVGDKLTISYALRHLGIAEHISGRLEQAREFLEESTRLRRELGFLPGVAANLVGLIHIAKAQGRTEDASALADEGAAIAKTSGATKILQQINEAGAGL